MCAKLRPRQGLNLVFCELVDPPRPPNLLLANQQNKAVPLRSSIRFALAGLTTLGQPGARTSLRLRAMPG